MSINEPKQTKNPCHSLLPPLSESYSHAHCTFYHIQHLPTVLLRVTIFPVIQAQQRCVIITKNKASTLNKKTVSRYCRDSLK